MKTRQLIAPALMTMLPTLAFAHPDHTLQSGLAAGVMHPLTGVDHLIAMLAVGIWAAQLGGRLRWAVPLSFVGVMLMSAMLGMSGLQFGAVEQGIAASICVLGLLLAGAVRLPSVASVLLVSVFAAFHGYAHGSEAPASGVALYMGGFAVSTAVLHATGLILSTTLLRAQQQAIRWMGAAMTVGGIALLMN